MAFSANAVPPPASDERSPWFATITALGITPMRLSWLLILPFVVYFVVAGILLLPYPGMENDESLFASGIYAPEQMEAHVRIFKQSICTMIMSYIGALKTWLYVPIFALWKPWSTSLRLPMVLAAAGAVCLFAALLNAISGRRAAVFGGVLLATDSVFLTTATFDWGPVALQQLLAIAALLLLVRFSKRRRERDLVLGFLLLGFALWNKAVFIWIFSGLAVATLIVLHRQVRELLTLRRALLAVCALLVGALPLIAFNIERQGATFTGKKYSLADVRMKVYVLVSTMKGDALAGFIVSNNARGNERPPATAVERASLWLSDVSGRRIKGLLVYAAIVALIAGLLSRRGRKPLLFFLVAFLVAWLEMLVTVEAGGSAHHTITLWPLLYGIIAVGLASIVSPRRVAVVLSSVIVGIVAVSNVIVTNEHLARLIRFGPEPLWTDAVFPLTKYLQSSGVPQVYAGDWGMGDTLRLLFDGKIQLGNAIEPFSRTSMEDEERRHINERLERTDALFVGYASGRKVFAQAEQLVLQVAEEAGYRREVVKTIHDANGRHVFDVYRFLRVQQVGTVDSRPGAQVLKLLR